MNYQILSIQDETTVVKILDDKKYYIPIDPDNTDYQEYLEWVAEGNTAESI
jgi:hypothetical protein